MKFRNDDAVFEREDREELSIKSQEERKKNVDDEKIVMKVEGCRETDGEKRENRERFD